MTYLIGIFAGILIVVTYKMGCSIYVPIGVFVAIMLAFVFVVLIGQKKALNLLEEECDPEAFLFYHQKQLKSNIKYSGSVTKLTSRINCAVAYLCMHQYEDALSMLDQVEVSQLHLIRNGREIYLVDRTLCYYGLGKMEEAEGVYQELLHKSEGLDGQLNTSIHILRGYFAYHRGSYEEAEKIYRDESKQTLSKRQRVELDYVRALALHKLGRLEEAKGLFQRVITDGNRLAVVKEAKELLKAM